MSWALQFNGIDTYMQAPVYSYSGNTFLITGRVKRTASLSDRKIIAIRQGWPVNQLVVRLLSYTSFSFFTRVNGAFSASDAVAIPSDGLFDFEVSLDATTADYTIKIDGVVKASGTLSNAGQKLTFSNADIFIGSETASSGFCPVNVEYININGERNYDATASDHSAGSQPILTDTIGGNDAIGVNFPTDVSAWVNLGGGGITGDITQTIRGLTQSASGTVTTIGFSGAITQTLQSFTQSATAEIKYTGNANQNILAFNQSLIGLVGSIGDITQTLNGFTQSATGQLSYQGQTTQTLASFTQSANGLIIVDITGTINQSVSAFTQSAIGNTPVTWVDQAKVTTNWSDDSGVITDWTDKAKVSTIWTEEV